MSKFHSTVNRRDFMKALGLAGAGLGAAAAAAPVFHDLSEVATSQKANFKHPWYVKELEFETASSEIDWSIFEKWSVGPKGFNPFGTANIIGYEPTSDMEVQSLEYRAEAFDARNKLSEDGLKNNTPGYQLRDCALSAGAGGFGPSTTWDGPRVTTPEDREVAKWTGTKEEAVNMLRAAAHLYGSEQVGAFELTSNMLKMLDPGAARIEGDVPYMDGRTMVIPSSCTYGLIWEVGQSSEMTKRGNTRQNAGASMGYSYGPIIQHRLQKFIKSLGYHALAMGWMTMMNVGMGVLTGLGELTRIGMEMTVKHGPMLRGTPTILTDLPLAPTKPIDAGLFKFCEACKLCGTLCDEVNGWTPINMDDEPTFAVPGPSNRVGVKKYPMEWGRCIFCPYCQGACPFGTHNMSTIHETVKAITATTPLFNSFFASMGDTFGYGIHDSPEECESWWDRDLNSYKLDVIYR